MCYNTHMRSATEKINAKINLSLNVVGKEDGYHMLDSVAASVDIADVITVYESKSPVAEFSNRDIDAEKSNAFAAAMFLTKKYSLPPVGVVVENNIPAGTGLGGSSADCAGVILAIKKAFLPNMTDEEIFLTAQMFGSDTPYMLRGGFARLNGRGEKIRRINSCLKCAVAIAYKDKILTKKCFDEFDRLRLLGTVADNDRLIDCLVRSDAKGVFSAAANALAPAAARLNPFVAEMLSADDGVAKCMTGSGSGIVLFGADGEYLDALRRSGVNVICTEIVPK